MCLKQCLLCVRHSPAIKNVSYNSSLFEKETLSIKKNPLATGPRSVVSQL